MVAAMPFQPSLLASGTPTPDASFARARRIDLDRGAWIDHAPGWLAGADTLFTELLESVPWRRREVAMYGRIVEQPRLSAWWGDDDVPERRLGAAPAALRALLPVLDARYCLGFDAIGLNLYRDGRDSVAWHGDRYEHERPATTVVIVSLGAPRRFLLRPVDTAETCDGARTAAPRGDPRRFDLHSGDLLVMGGTCQHTWQHCVPKVARAGPRMSATFRRRIHPAEARGRIVPPDAA